MSKTLRTVLAVLCVLVIALCAVLILQKAAGRARVDLTQDRLYALSDGTRHILAQLNQPVTLRLFYSRTAAMKGPEGIRYYNTYYLYVRDLLEEYARLANGRLRVEVVDPRRFTDEEEEAGQLGLKRFPLSDADVFFFGLVAKTEFGKVKVIPFFEPDRLDFVEYDVSKLISSVMLRDKKKVGVISSLEVAGADLSPYMMQMMRMQGREAPKPWTIVTSLRDTYEVQSLAKEIESVPPGIDFLMVVHPKELPKKTLFAIDQFVVKGGRLMVFVDPWCFLDVDRQRGPRGGMDQKRSSELNDLLRGWGVEMDPDEIAVDRALAVRSALMPNQRPEPIYPFMQLKDESMNQGEVITAPLHDVKVLFAGVLRPVEGKGVRVTPLLSTTATGNVWKPANPFELQYPNAEAIRRAVSDGTKPLTLACRLTGKFRTNFPEGIEIEDAPPPAPEGADKPKEEPKKRKLDAVKEASADGTVLVFADVDMIADLLAYRDVFFGTAQSGDNAPLVFNALDFLAGSGDLIAIRSRGGFQRPFAVVDRIEREADAATADEVAAVNERIKQYQEKLGKLGAAAKEGNEKLIAGEALAERNKVQEDIRKAEKELRLLNARKRARIEDLGARLKTHNLVWAPAAVLAIAVALSVVRYIRARRYVARRAS
jgi:ABC-type uncharacterized transport system involved in gliding motility auxiliary subunit